MHPEYFGNLRLRFALIDRYVDREIDIRLVREPEG
jgi:hypothetical protein